MIHALETIKEHPYAVGGVVLVAGGILILMLHKGSGNAVTTYNPTNQQNPADVAAATQVYQTQSALAAHSMDVNAALTAKSGDNALALSLAQLDQQTSHDANSLQYGLAIEQMASQNRTNTLQASLAEANLANEADARRIQYYEFNTTINTLADQARTQAVLFQELLNKGYTPK